MLWSAPWIEALRARPGTAALVAGLSLGLIWVAVPLIFYASPPRELVEYLIHAREWRATPDAGGPLAAWSQAIAFSLAGMPGIYILYAVSTTASAWLAYRLARRLLGRAMGGAAALLMVAMLAIVAPFSPDRLVLPIILWLMREAWRLLVERKSYGWPLVAAAAGAALFCGWAGWTAIAATGLLLGFTTAGRDALRSPDLVQPIAVLLTFIVPFLFWVGFAVAENGFGLTRFTLELPIPLLSAAIAALAAGCLIALVASPLGDKAHVGEVPELTRPPLPPPGTPFLRPFGFLPAVVLAVLVPFGVSTSFLGMSVVITAAIALIAARSEQAGVHRRRLVALLWLICVLALPATGVAMTVAGPQLRGRAADANFPSRAIAQPLTQVVASRTGRPLSIIGGDSFLAGSLALASPAHPSVMPDADPAKAPWIGADRLAREGMVVVWRITDRNAEPPFELRSRWPALKPEAPIVVQWAFGGGLEPVRVGWAIVPGAAGATPAQ